VVSGARTTSAAAPLSAPPARATIEMNYMAEPVQRDTNVIIFRNLVSRLT